MEFLILIVIGAAGIAILASVIYGISMFRSTSQATHLTAEQRKAGHLLALNLIEPGVTSLFILGITSLGMMDMLATLFGGNITGSFWLFNPLIVFLLLLPMWMLIIPPWLASRSDLQHHAIYRSLLIFGGLRYVVTFITYFWVVPVVAGIPLLVVCIKKIREKHLQLINNQLAQAVSVGAEGIMVVDQSSLKSQVRINL